MENKNIVKVKNQNQVKTDEQLIQDFFKQVQKNYKPNIWKK